jgi:hypothetical protein
VAAFAGDGATGAELLTPREVALIALAAEDPTASQADLAAALKISVRHVRRLLARQRVRKALDAAARAGLEAGAAVLGRSAQRAAQSLVEMAVGKVRASSPRVAACRAVLDGAGRLIDLVDLERRIAGIERDRVPSAGWGPQ